jgi:peptide deformylase
MALRHILHHPDPRLRLKAAPVMVFDRALRELVDDMFDTMYAAPGIGLAATQVNVQLQVIVIDVSAAKNEPHCLVNPELITLQGTAINEEGCLSVPGVYDYVERAERIVLRAADAAGTTRELAAEGLLAVCIQHEIDHLDGKLFVDHLSLLKQSRIRKKLLKEQRSAI